MRTKAIKNPLLKITVAVLFVAGAFLLSFSTLGFGTARADAPSSLSPEWAIGTNLINNADFEDAAERDDAQTFLPTIAAETPAANRQEWNHIDDLASYNGALPAGMGSINTAMQSTFGSVTHMGETIEVGGMGGLTTGSAYYFSAWVRTTTPVYFDIVIGGPNRITNDLGRRFRVAPEDGWTQIGLNDAGSAFLPFRTTTNTNGFMPNSSAANEIPPDEDSGNVRRVADGSGWVNLFIVTAPAAMGWSWTTPLFDAGESYMITGLRLWEGGATQAPEYLMTSGLATAITNAQDRIQANYTTESWEDLQTALTAATTLWTNLNLGNNVAFNPTAQTDIDNTAAALNAALAELESVSPTLALGALRHAINNAEAVERVNRSQASWDTFVVARTAAIALYNNGSPADGTTQEQITGAATALNNAMSYFTFDIGPSRFPSQTRAEFGIGPNLIQNGNFEQAITRGDGVRGEPVLPHHENIEVQETALGTYSMIEDLTEYNPIPAMGDINTALRLNFGSGYLPHDGPSIDMRTHPWQTPDHLMEPGVVHFFTAWVRAIDTAIDFDVFVSGGPAIFDLGRRFRVVPADGWVQIGVGPDGNFLPFRTTGTGRFHSDTTASRGLLPNEDAGNTTMQNNNNAGQWSSLVVASFRVGTPGMPGTGNVQAPASGGYMITGMRLWRLGDTDTSELGGLVREFDNTRNVYSPATWAAYVAAANTGRQLLRTESPSQSDVAAAVDAIITTRDNLFQEHLYVDDLRDAMNNSLVGLVQTNFTVNSWNAVQVLLGAADILWDDLGLDAPVDYDTVDQLSIDIMESSIRVAVNGLVNIEEFLAVMLRVDGLNEGNYTRDSWSALQDQIEIYRDVPVSGADWAVIDASADISNAIDRLVRREPGYGDCVCEECDCEDCDCENCDCDKYVPNGGNGCGCGSSNIAAGMLALIVAAGGAMLFLKRKE